MYFREIEAEESFGGDSDKRVGWTPARSGRYALRECPIQLGPPPPHHKFANRIQRLGGRGAS